MEPRTYLWLIPILPLLGATLNGVLGRRFSRAAVSAIALLSTGLSCALAIFEVVTLSDVFPIIERHFTWIQAGSLRVGYDLLLDPLSSVMVLVVTVVGLLIHIYSVGYMAHEEGPNFGGFYRFFSYMNLFMFAMLTLVLANNYVLMFVGWEGVGLCSYLLIGFYFRKQSASDAGKKAFITNRIGDFGLTLGLFSLFWMFGTLDYQPIFARAAAMPVEPLHQFGALTIITLLLFIGATGKSAQIPLYVWLPDAMEGPTPVSALIHAATMVTAGVYMMARSNVLFSHAPTTLLIVAVIGAITALFAGTMGLVQRDMKRILAYSTISQLGYMFLACGVGAYAAGIFHLMTHAFFKALLFLAAGSVMHAMRGELDIFKMGGLRKKMATTYWTFLIASLAIAGIPGFSGFFSKDEILWRAFNSPEYGRLLWAVGWITAGLTALYMFRIVFVAFHGEFRGGDEAWHHAHESPRVIRVPLVLLAVGALLAGYVQVPKFIFGGVEKFSDFLAPVFASTTTHGVAETAVNGGHHLELGLTALSVLIALAGIGIAYLVFRAKPERADLLEQKLKPLHSLLFHKYWIDELYSTLFIRPIQFLSTWVLWKIVDLFVIDGLGVNGSGFVVRGLGRGLRHLQSGRVRAYAGWVVLGAVLIVAFLVFKV
ncbi:MAG: NADH-quinone oxidoreductase subunit L [Acidobacteriia bacterium]|nr:NADH-quinone oxidoreductase subunit L [Terriglobia bacterium]